MPDSTVFPAPFTTRHIGPSPAQQQAMLAAVGVDSLDALVDEAVPGGIRTEAPLSLPGALSEDEALARLASIADQNTVLRSFLGYGYHDTVTPPVILRNVLENPGWYTAYTPYQAEISQGRLEALLIFQTMVEDLTGMAVSNASLLDEATACAEAMAMAHRLGRGKRDTLLVADDVHPQNLAVMRTRAEPLGIGIEVLPVAELHGRAGDRDVYGALVQYPATDGTIHELGPLADALHRNKAKLCVATDLLALTVLEAPGTLGADIVVGNTQRFGVPLGYGGPHAAFLATSEAHRRSLPGRVIGISKDAAGQPALRMALQTREQHIRRQKATSNICTAQVLLAVCAGLYAVWHGPEGLRALASRRRDQTATLARSARAAGATIDAGPWFDTMHVELDSAAARTAAVEAARAAGFNLRPHGDRGIIIALDERTTDGEIAVLCNALDWPPAVGSAAPLPPPLARTTPFLGHRVFHEHRSETRMLRFLSQLQKKDLALDTSMIPLGSCTMKLNATAEMMPITWRQFGGLHPFVPLDQAAGYTLLFESLEAWLAEITGFDAVSLQPNAGSQGEYAGLLSIRAWHRSRGDDQRTVCLIPTSAHGTNPASAVMAGMRVVAVACDEKGNIDVDDLREKAAAHTHELAALMVTYPSTHGVFDERIREICDIVHTNGGQVYMDGANMNAMVGLARPAEIGADVLHLNLHKTFCIPHGGGGPGMGPIGVRAHLAPFLPGSPVVDGVGGELAMGDRTSVG